MPSRPLRHALISTGRGLRSGWLLLGLTLVFLLVVELLLRGAFALKDALAPLPEPDPRVVAEGYEGAAWVPRLYREQAALRTEWRPYVTHRVRPFSGEQIAVDPEGLRRTLLPGDARDDAPLVWLCGGSVAWGMGARDQATIASRLAARMAERGRPVRVVNRAQIGYVQTQELADVLLALRGGERPDAIIFLDGVNDVLAAYQNGVAGWPQNEGNRVAEFNLRESPPRLAGALLGTLARTSALGRMAGSLARRLRGGLSPPPSAREAWGPRLAEDVAAVCAANLRLLDELAHGLAIEIIVAWQPVLFTKTAKTDYERSKASEYDWLRLPLAQAAERLARIGPDSDRLRTLDLTHLLDTASGLVFVDFCHVTEAGHDRIASALAEALLAALDEKPAVAADPGRPAAPP